MISGGGRPSQCPPLEESVVGYFLAGVDPRTLLPPVYGWQNKEGHGTFHHIHHDIGYHDHRCVWSAAQNTMPSADCRSHSSKDELW